MIERFDSPEFGTLRVVEKDGEPWFVAKDVCAALELNQVTNAVRRLDDDEHTLISNKGKGINVVNEPGLYSLVLSSRKPEARAFKRWVTHEVLPEIRKRGGYMVARADETPEQLMARALKIADETLKRQQAQIEELKPKALFADAVAASDGTCLVGEFAKMLRQNGVDIGQNRLFAWLRDHGYLGKSGSNRNVPTQRAMDMGLFRIKETAVTHADGHVTINRTPKLTGRGQRHLLDKFLGGAA